MKPIIVDAMGGDYAPLEAVAGAALFAQEHPDVPVMMVGNAAEVEPLLGRYFPGGMGQVSFRHAAENVGGGEKVQSARRKKDSSLAVGCQLVKAGEGSALVALGNTAAVVGMTHLTWGMLPGVSRAGIAVLFPAENGVTLGIDMGANTRAKPEHLFDYAVMASIYSERVLGVKSPRVGMINVGEEEGKGGEAMRKIYQLLEQCPVNFKGNAEGRDFVSGKFDVVVCDGFVGNVALKASEAAVEFLVKELRKALTRTVARKLAAYVLKGAFGELKKRIDYAEYGGMPLLGVNGICIVGHGRSRALAFKNAIGVAAQAVRVELNNVIMAGLAEMRKGGDLPTTASA